MKITSRLTIALLIGRGQGLATGTLNTDNFRCIENPATPSLYLWLRSPVVAIVFLQLFIASTFVFPMLVCITTCTVCYHCVFSPFLLESQFLFVNEALSGGFLACRFFRVGTVSVERDITYMLIYG